VNRLAYHFLTSHSNMRHSTLFLSLIFLLSTAHAQVAPGIVPTGAVRPFTGPVRPFTGPVRPPTATPVLAGPHGFAPHSSRPSIHHDGGDHHRYPYPYLGYGAVYGYGVPYADDPNGDDQGYDATDDSNYQGGPTVFDRRGSGAQSYVPPVENVPAPHAEQSANSAPDPQPVQPPTLLVFKDGHKLEVGNYAIVGTTLFDLTPGHPRKIALADLDLQATQKQNEDRGVVFQLPPSLQAS